MVTGCNLEAEELTYGAGVQIEFLVAARVFQLATAGDDDCLDAKARMTVLDGVEEIATCSDVLSVYLPFGGV